MCDPIALTIASAAASYAGQQQAANAQEAANEQSRNLIIQNQNLQVRALQNQEEESSRQAELELQENAKRADALRATTQVAAGESGISGLSLDALLGDITLTESTNAFNITDTFSFGQRQRELDLEGTGITAQSQVNQLPLVQQPDLFGTALSAAGDVYGIQQQRADRQRRIDVLGY